MRWIDANPDQLTGKIIAMPQREDIQLPVNEQQIVDLSNTDRDWAQLKRRDEIRVCVAQPEFIKQPGQTIQDAVQIHKNERNNKESSFFVSVQVPPDQKHRNNQSIGKPPEQNG